MSQSLLRPDFKADIAGLDKRVGNLERRTTPTPAAPSASIMFSYAGALTATISPPTRVRSGGTLTELAVTLGTPGSTDTTLVVARNADVVATITVPAGAMTFDASIGARFGPGDLLRLVIDPPGTGAGDMTAEARF